MHEEVYSLITQPSSQQNPKATSKTEQNVIDTLKSFYETMDKATEGRKVDGGYDG